MLSRLRQDLLESEKYTILLSKRDRVEKTLLGRIVRNYLDDDADGIAGMLAYNALFSVMPVLMAIGLIVGLVVQSEVRRQEISDLVTEELPPSLAEPIVDWIDASADHSGSVGIVTIGTLLYGGSRLYSGLDRALAIVFCSRRRGYLKRKLFAFLVAPVMAAGLVTSTVVSAVATSFLSTSLGRYLEVDLTVLNYLSAYLIAFLLGFAMSLTAYAIVPINSAGWRGSIPGAGVAGVLFVLLSQLYPLYISIVGGFGVYGTIFGFVLVFMFWLYLAAQIIIIGAEITAVMSGIRDLFNEPDNRNLEVAAS